MTEWLMTAQMGLAALVILLGPGLATAYAVGLRGLIAWGSAPMMSGAIIALAAIAAPLVGLSWSIWVLAGATVVFTAICYGMWRLSGRWRGPVVRSSPRLRRRMALVVGGTTLVAAAFEARHLFTAIGSPNSVPSQPYDTAYHLNSVMLILQTGNGSSLNMSLTTAGQPAYYPAVWHDITALVAQLTGSNVPAAANWVTIVLASVAWPLALLALARILFGPRPWLLALTGSLAFSLTYFPNLLVGWGVLYPNLTSIAFLPAVLAGICLVLWRSRGRQRWAPLTVVGAGCIALLFAQPNCLFAIGYLLIPILGFYLWGITRRKYRQNGWSWRLLIPWAIGVAVFLLAFAATELVPRVAEFRTQVSWPATMSSGEAIENVVSLALTNDPGPIPNVPIAIAVAVGFVAALFIRRWRWVAVGYVVLAWLYVVSAASGNERMREFFTGYWYGDSQRLIAQLPTLAIPLAAIGCYVIVRMAAGFLVKFRPSLGVFRRLATIPVFSIAIIFLVIFALPRTEEAKQTTYYLQELYDQSPPVYSSGGTGIVDKDFLESVDDIERIVPAGQKIANNPWEGSTLVWPLADREPLFPFQKMTLTSDQEIIAEELNQANWNPEVCPALEREDVHYVLRASRTPWAPADLGYQGLNGIVSSGVAKLVYSNGDTRLYEITACQ